MLDISERFPATALLAMHGTVPGIQALALTIGFTTPTRYYRFSIKTTNATIQPPLITGGQKITYIAAEAYLSATAPLPQYGSVLINNGLLHVELFSTDTSTDITGIVESGERLTLPDNPFPDIIIVQRTALNWIES